MFPIAPSETVLVTGGILIERGDLIAQVFVLAAACGAVLGDSILFGLGSRAGPGLRAKLFSSERARERLRVVERLVHERAWLLIVSDFVPAGARLRCLPPARSAAGAGPPSATEGSTWPRTAALTPSSQLRLAQSDSQATPGNLARLSSRRGAPMAETWALTLGPKWTCGVLASALSKSRARGI